jgi:RNA polymerase sigma factor (sigma-70 family)
MNDLLRRVRTAALVRDGGGLSDGELLECFLGRRDEAAFAALVRRHGPLVLGVCRRVLGNHHDAEDALQATFLVLARKAASVRARAVLGPWLYGVAYRTALRARTMAARRRLHEQRAKDQTRPPVPPDDSWQELLPLLDRELDGLPERYRVAVVLCDLEGMTRREAARRLNLPEGTLSGRLTRARKLLARRLARYGAGLSGTALAAVLADRTASAGVTAALATATARAAVLPAAGLAQIAGTVPARVITLTEGVMKAMLLTRLKAILAVAFVVLVSAGAVGLTYRTGTAQVPASGPAPRAERPPADDLEELRLEVAALRKGLEATRQRVKTLEAEVQTLKGKGGAASPYRGKAPDSADPNVYVPKYPEAVTEYSRYLAKIREGQRAIDPLAEAEAALKKLRQDPKDPAAKDALKRALQRLTEGDKQRGKPEEY